MRAVLLKYFLGDSMSRQNWEPLSQVRDWQTVARGPNLGHCLPICIAHEPRMVFTILNG